MSVASHTAAFQFLYLFCSSSFIPSDCPSSFSSFLFPHTLFQFFKPQPFSSLFLTCTSSYYVILLSSLLEPHLRPSSSPTQCLQIITNFSGKSCGNRLASLWLQTAWWNWEEIWSKKEKTTDSRGQKILWMPQSSLKHLPVILAVVQPEWPGGSLCKLEGGCQSSASSSSSIGFLYGITQEKVKVLREKNIIQSQMCSEQTW